MSETQSRPKMSVLSGRMSHLCAVIGSHMFMVGGYHKGEGDERFKDRDISVHLSDINIYSIRDVSFIIFKYIMFLFLLSIDDRHILSKFRFYQYLEYKICSHLLYLFDKSLHCVMCPLIFTITGNMEESKSNRRHPQQRQRDVYGIKQKIHLCFWWTHYQWLWNVSETFSYSSG